ncbi:MAG: GTP-binding protein [Methanomicrobiales archaeon]|nr:GTP-binding protein [Methanomicrobiales archaeon]
MNNRLPRHGKLKIGVFGPYHAGKSSFIRSIDPHARHTEANTAGGECTTVAIDFGRTAIGDWQVYLFGTPGQERFEFVRSMITRNLDGALLLIDPMAGLKSMHYDIHRRLKEEGIPVAFLINKCDASPNNRILRDQLKEEVVHEISALDPVSSRRALESFVHGIPVPKDPFRKE